MSAEDRRQVTVELNGDKRSVLIPAHQLLLDTLREELGAYEVRYGCGEGVCGTCTVLLDGEPVSSCLVLTAQVRGRRVTTVRGLAASDDGLHGLQRAFLAHGAAQCGFCTPAMLLTLDAAIESGARSRDDLRTAISGNLCRCTGYGAILDSAEAFVRERSELQVTGRR
jgi:carbon-monoxide dehydrogenase small subunit